MVLRGVLLTTYAILWSILFGVVILFPACVADDYMRRHGWGIGDDWGWLTAPIGMAFGIWFAIRSRRARWLHLFCIPLGIAAAAYFFWQSHHLAQLAEAHKGMGGLGEALGSVVTCVWGVLAIIVATTGVFGTFLRWQERRLA